VSEAQDVYVFGDKTIVGLMAKWSPAGSSNRNGSSSLNTLAVSCNGGRVYLFDIVGKTFFRLFDKEVVSPMEVVDMQWDKLSAQYLLVAYDALIILWDALTHEKVQVFEKQNVSITSIAWLDWAAGSFISTNDKTGIVKTWNASQRAPLESFRSTVGGIQSVCTIPQSQSVMTACVDGSFNVFDVQHKHLVFKTSTSHSETIFNCDFCPTSAERFATVSHTSVLRRTAE
jgi:WD40 repeat protein